MNKRNEKPYGDIELSRYLDGELAPEQRAKVEKRLQESSEDRQSLQRLQTLSNCVRENAGFHWTSEEEASFDALLARRLRTVSPKKSWIELLLAPFLTFRNLSWQWQAALALSLLLIGYVPILMKTPLDDGPDSAPLINSDYPNYETFFDADPEAGYDLYGVGIKPDEDERQSPEKTPTPSEKNSSIQLNAPHRV